MKPPGSEHSAPAREGRAAIAGTPWTDAESDRLRHLHKQGASLHSIAQQMGRSKDTVRRWSKHLGLSYDRAATAQATAALSIDNKNRRAVLENQLLTEAERMFSLLHQPHLVWSFGGRDNTYAEHLLDRPDVNAQKTIIQTIGIAVDKAMKIAVHDKNDGTEAAKSVMGGLQSALQFLASTVSDEEGAGE